MINSSSKDNPCVATTCAEGFVGAPSTFTVGREIDHHPQFEITPPYIDWRRLDVWISGQDYTWRCWNNLSLSIGSNNLIKPSNVVTQCRGVSRTILPLEDLKGGRNENTIYSSIFRVLQSELTLQNLFVISTMHLIQHDPTWSNQILILILFKELLHTFLTHSGYQYDRFPRISPVGEPSHQPSR